MTKKNFFFLPKNARGALLQDTNLWVKVNEGISCLTGPCAAGVSKRPEKCMHSTHRLFMSVPAESNSAQNRPVTSGE